MAIKKRNLSSSLVNWVMSATGLGPGVGKIHYLVPASTNYRTWLQEEHGVSAADMYTSLATAHANMTADRNDVLLVMPGLYTETVTCDWTKDHTHIIGLAGYNILQRQGRPNCLIYNDTAGVDYAIHITGDFCQFQNVGFQNGTTGGSATGDNLSACGVAGYGNYFSRCHFRGINTAAQIAVSTTSSLDIMKGAGELMFEDCEIGHNGFGGTRTAAGGHLLFSQSDSSTPSPQNGIFRRCYFHTRSETAACGMVYVAYYLATDRVWFYDDCAFVNWSPNWVSALTAVFNFANLTGMQTTRHILRHCSATGFTYWVTNNFGGASGNAVEADMPITGTAGGLTRAPSGTVGN